MIHPNGPFALLHREGREHVELFAGPVTTVDRLADIPDGHVLAAVPYRQVRERGFEAVDDGTPLACLLIERHDDIPLSEMTPTLPTGPVTLRDGAFDLTDNEYGEIVRTVLSDEIGRGEGANFVIHRTFTATVVGDPLTAALAAFRRLLCDERGAYWTFLVHLGDRTLVGATPERHVSVEDGLVMMNPISGTYRGPGTGAGWTEERSQHLEGPGARAGEGERQSYGSGDLDGLLAFLADPKETDELYMVLDEELKMMATVADLGGQVVGPYLKEMSHLIHTEYLLAGRGSRDVRDVLRETMFAPTVTGSPIENACRVIARHERRGRGYYAGVLALIGRDAAGRATLDAPILIRTAEITAGGQLRVPVGATLVRHSTADGEVAETYTKAAGVMAAFGLRPPSTSDGTPAARYADHPAVREALARRNDHLSHFWLQERGPGMAAAAPELAGLRALVVDGEDTFTGMLAHLLRALGLDVTVRPWTAAEPAGFDLVIPGPGPGDPTDPTDVRMTRLRGLIRTLLDAGTPMLAVCLGHQLLAAELGLTLHRRDAPYQGLQREIELFGRRYRVGFYASFTALSDVDSCATPYGEIELSRDGADGAVHALRGRTFAGVQFHPESVLTEQGGLILAELVAPLLVVRRR